MKDTIKKLEKKIEILENMVEDRSRELYIKNKQNEELLLSLEIKQNNLNRTALISETDLSGKITFANNKFCEISKYSKEELIGRDHRMLNSGIHDKEFWQGCWNTIKGGEIWRGEVCNKAKDDSLYWVDATIMPIKDINGKITGYSAIRVDITEKKIEANKQLQHTAKLASIGELAAGVGHEINNPLTIVVGNITLIKNMLAKENIHNKNVYDRLNNIEIASERIRKIVDGLRTYARSDSDKNEIIPLRKVVDQTVGLISEIYEKEGISITRETPDANFYIRGSMGKLQQVLMNLISNAKDATINRKNAAIKISLKKAENNNVIFSVSDNGAGITEEIKNKIFNPFFTTKKVGLGTGLGLGLVLEITKKMGGKVQLESVVGGGSTFSVVLPLIDSNVFQQQQQQQQQLHNDKKGLHNHKKISGDVLVVDDEEEIREILRIILEELGCTVEEACNGKEALEKILINHYDYVFTDLQMPEMGGIEFLREIHKLRLIHRPQLIAVTGGVTTDFSKEGQDELSSMIDGHLLKPFGHEKIKNILLETTVLLKKVSNS